MIRYDHHYYDGAWQKPSTSDATDVVSSSTEEAIGSVPRGSADDVSRAVAAARKAFESWSRTPTEERATWLE